MSDDTNTNEPEATGHEPVTVPPQVLYGISVFQCEDDRPIVHVTGEPDMGQLQRLLATASNNLQADIIARKVVERLEQAQAQRRIIRPGG